MPDSKPSRTKKRRGRNNLTKKLFIFREKIANFASMEWLQITTSTALYRFRTEEIVCVHADGNYSDVFTCSGKPRKLTFKLHQFDEWFATLQHNTFVRVGRSFIVNKSYVQAINLTENRIILAGGNLKEPMVYGGFSRESLRQLKNELERKEEKTND